METVQYNLPQDRIPRAWYNILADLPDAAGAAAASRHAASRSGRTIWRRCFP